MFVISNLRLVGRLTPTGKGETIASNRAANSGLRLTAANFPQSGSRVARVSSAAKSLIEGKCAISHVNLTDSIFFPL
jgi:hypothetical protein